MTPFATSNSLVETGREKWENCQLGLKMAVLFFSTKAARSGPRYIVPIAIALSTGFVLVKLLLLYSFSSTAPDYIHNIASWATGDQNTPEQDGGLRIIVFGAPDIATPPRAVGDDDETGLSWTEQLCAELECSDHLSFIPTSKEPVHSLTSNSLYNIALEKLLSSTHDSPEPGMNYTFMQQFYSPPNQFDDLRTQMSNFLAMKRSTVVPRETLYIFSFGMWDVWHLAAMPLEAGYTAIGHFTRDIFDQVEALYEEAQNPDSIAYSSGTATHVNDTKPSQETFRIIVPRLFDPSLAPGWKSRQTPPKPHNSAEHVKNSAYLTMRWNWEIKNHIQAWMHKNKDNAAKIRSNPELPLRDVIVPDISGYVVNAMIDSQMKYSGLVDHTPGSNLGAIPVDDSFTDVVTPCTAFSNIVSGEKNKMQVEQCNNNHLYLSEFSVTSRATQRVGHMVADMVVNHTGGVMEEWKGGRKGRGSKHSLWDGKGIKTFLSQ